MDFSAIKEAMERGGSGSEVLARVVISTCWENEPMSLYSLKRLDGINRAFAYEIMDYRRREACDEQKFDELALHAKDILQSIDNLKNARDINGNS